MGVQDDVDDGPGALGDHAVEGAACGLEQPLQHDLGKAGGGQAGHDGQVVPAEVLDRGVIDLDDIVPSGEEQAEHDEEQGAEQDQQDAGQPHLVGPLPVAGPQGPREQGPHAYAQAHRDGDHQVLDREGQPHGGEGVLADMGDEDAVYDVVQGLDQHGQHHRQGHGDQQTGNGHGAHLVLLRSRFFVHGISVLLFLLW